MKESYATLRSPVTNPAPTWLVLDAGRSTSREELARSLWPRTIRWRDYGASVDRDKFAYDHDYNSNRKYRENVVAGAASKKLDELYAYDDLDRLADFKRGKLDGPKTEIPYQNPADRLTDRKFDSA